jgi:hypothetical protein
VAGLSCPRYGGIKGAPHGSFQLREVRDRSLFDARTFGLYAEWEASLDEVRQP